MQDEINSQVVALSIRAASNGFRVTSSVLKAAMRQYLEGQKQKTAARNAGKNQPQQYIHGKQTIGELMDQNQGLTNIEITNQNIKSFERVANKYHIDFALKKDKSADPPRYLVFFKSRDVDVMTAAFKEFSSKELAKSKRPSIVKGLVTAKEAVKAQQKQREKVKSRDRGQEH